MARIKTIPLLTADIMVVRAGGIMDTVLEARTVEMILRTVQVVATPVSAVTELSLTATSSQLAFF